MSEITTTAGRDEKSGRFQSGNVGGPGRKPGSRNKLGEAFLEDLRDAWNEHGAAALARCAEEEPAAFCKIVASLLPRDVRIDVSVDAAEFAATFRSARQMLGNDPEPPLLRKSLQTIAPRTIEHDDAG